MTDDAKYEDGADSPLKLMAEDVEDLKVIATLVQDSVIPVSEISWRPKQNRFALLINRVRWEDKVEISSIERVQSVLVFDDISTVSTLGIDQNISDNILSLLTISWESSSDTTGVFQLVFSGNSIISLKAECINILLRDVTRPYQTNSKKRPKHDNI
ncbi:MAG: DUF2948 family protein [Paracoccaceae bacterium]|nr:hypothetical protein [Paracoccaceae bacterium]|tara:strand:+ start:1652 stop:2122 length:471 start_codon:yes stop_codon:yes gene_type:complete